MKNQDKLTVSNNVGEINYIAKVLEVKPFVIHLAKYILQSNKRSDITTWVNHNKNLEVSVTIE